MQTIIVPDGKGSHFSFKKATSLDDLQDGTNNVFSIVPKVAAKGILELYENSIKFYHPDQQTPNTEPPERIENDIKEFSNKSRKRLFDIFNRLNYSSYGIPMFLSLTWHYDDPKNKIVLKGFLRAYFKRLFRSLPAFHYIWKFEYQKRGTPHFHIMLLPLDKKVIFYSEEIEKIIKAHWLELKTCKCKHCKEYAAHVIKVSTYKMALSYIAKEIAKIEDRYEEHDLGRIWGTSREIRINKIDEIKISLNDYEKYLNKAIEILENKLKETPSEKLEAIKKINSSILYIQGLKYVPFNSTVYINHKEIQEIFREDKAREKFKSLPQKLILKKFNWR